MDIGSFRNISSENFSLWILLNTLFLAPEGSHRFYIEGYSGRVGASWMTKEDREVDIANYITYLNTLYDHVMKNVQAKKVNVLGFSQGAATVSRWVADRHIQFDNLILWAGVFPPDMNFEADKQYLNSKKVYVLVGDQDEFINEEAVKQHVNQLREKGIQFELIRFNGNHDVKSTPLEKLAKNL